MGAEPLKATLNPTHVAVTLRYDKKNVAAPIVITKSYDEVAQRIKALAREHGIPQVEDVLLARALAMEVAIGKWYQAVVGVLSYVYKLRLAG